MADEEVSHYFGNAVQSDLLRLVAGYDPIGDGMSRTVYPCLLDRSLVLKFEVGAGRFQNVKEWEVWQEVRDYDRLAKWLAPCVDISPCGTVLVMKRTHPLPKQELPKRVPSCFTDFKVSNWGQYDGRPVCHDYGTALLLTKEPTRLKKVTWWNEDGD